MLNANYFRGHLSYFSIAVIGHKESVMAFKENIEFGSRFQRVRAHDGRVEEQLTAQIFVHSHEAGKEPWSITGAFCNLKGPPS